MTTSFSLSSDHGHRRPEVLRAQHRYGLFYGAMLGLSFAIFAWGVDAYLLSQAHAIQPWLKLIIGAVVCIPVGGLAGWLTMRFERSLLAIPFWLAAAAVFAWMTVALPLEIFPRMLVALEPDLKGLISYFLADELTVRFGVSFVWVALFVALAGVLEIPMGQPAAFSTSVMGKWIPVLVCAVLMGIGGTLVEADNNKPLRSAIIAFDATFQFMQENQGKPIDSKVSRDLHLAAMRDIEDLVGGPRELTIGSFDNYLEQVHVLVRFGDVLVDCMAIYDQPSSCKRISP